MQHDVWERYQASHPGKFVMLGPDVMVSGPGGITLAQFRINAGGLTFPLLRDCADGTTLADSNLIKPYNQRDNYVVIDADGIIRYHADDFWDYGGRLHLDELYAAIDGALADVLSAPPPHSGRLSLTASPNPSAGRVVFALAGATTVARFRVLDLAGREVAAFAGPASGPGAGHIVWDARAADGRALAPGLYLVQVTAGSQHLTRRIVLAH